MGKEIGLYVCPKDVMADMRSARSRIAALETEVKRLQGVCTAAYEYVAEVARWQQNIWNPPDVDSKLMLKTLSAAQEPVPKEEAGDG